MLKIWGRISSINVRKVVLAAQMLGLEFERVDAGQAFGIVRTPTYLDKNPNALVPTIEDGDVLLWESNVIVRYLCAKYGASGSVPGAAAGSAVRLYPEALAARFDAERWMDWQQTTLNPAGRDAFWQLIRVPADQRDAALIERSVANTEPLMTLLETHLSRQSWMAGDALTMADIPIACEIHRWRGLPLAHPARPHLERWYGNICALPAARGVLDLPLS